MKKRYFLAFILTSLISCKGNSVSSSCGCDDSGYPHSESGQVEDTYQPFGNLDAEIVQKICESFSVRKGNDASHGIKYKIEEDLGVYHDNVYVDAIKCCGAYQAEKHYYVEGVHVYSYPDMSVELNVYVLDDKSYDIQDAYNLGFLTYEDLVTISEINN